MPVISRHTTEILFLLPPPFEKEDRGGFTFLTFSEAE